MKKYFKECIAAISFIILFYSTGFAGGIGVYTVLGTGINTLNTNMQNNVVKNGFMNQKTDNVRSFMSYGAGLIADTNLDGEKIFNYRFKLGYDYQVSDSDENKKLHRGMLTNIFGFGLYRDEQIRLWIGPLVGIGYLGGENTYTDNRFKYLGSFLPIKTKMEISMLDVNIGMELGIDINVVKSVTFSFEGGFQYNFYYNFDKKYVNLKTRIEDYFPMMGPEGFISFAVMNRFETVKQNERGAIEKGKNIFKKNDTIQNNQDSKDKYTPLDEPPEKL